MGLDMYLTGRVSAGKYFGEERHAALDDPATKVGLPPLQDVDFISIERKVGYWRKANAIHQWFVENVQQENDDCREYYVSRDQLTKLRDTCLEVLQASTLVPGNVKNGMKAGPETNGKFVDVIECGEIVLNSKVAEELLPTQAGFFFGGTDYDQWYVENLRDTIKQIDAALTLPEHVDFYYQSSW